MSCHESLVREFLQKTETGLCLDRIRTKRSTKCSLEHVSRAAGVQTTGVGQLVVMPGAGLETEEEGCNCRDKYYDPCQHPFIVGDYHIYIYHDFYNSTTHFLQLQNIECTDGVNNDAWCSDVDKSSALLSEDCLLTCTQRQQASLINNLATFSLQVSQTLD